MKSIVYAIGAIAILGGGVSLLACGLAIRRMNRERGHARRVAASALKQLAEQGKADVTELKQLGERGVPERRARSGVRMRARRRAELLRYSFLYEIPDEPTEPEPVHRSWLPILRAARPESPIRGPVADIPLDVFASDAEVRAHVLAGLLFLHPPEREGQTEVRFRASQ